MNKQDLICPFHNIKLINIDEYNLMCDIKGCSVEYNVFGNYCLKYKEMIFFYYSSIDKLVIHSTVRPYRQFCSFKGIKFDYFYSDNYQDLENKIQILLTFI